MADSLAAPLAGVALAAGAGVRLRPLTLLRPKPLCPVGDRVLLDWALERLGAATSEVAVNVHHGAGLIVEHLHSSGRRDSVHLSSEERALGTAGALGRLRTWLAGRGALVVNTDTWHRADLRRFSAGWDGERVRLLTTTPLPFGPASTVVASILPWPVVSRLAAEPSGLWEVVWRGELADGRVDAVHEPVLAVDCGTPADYLRANLEWSGGRPVIGEAARVEGTLLRSVVWPGSRVWAGEHLVDAIRAGRRTVMVR
jgi:N-acetyl-alpha-D-muramate 1-phosphate uridylyltransferase